MQKIQSISIAFMIFMVAGCASNDWSSRHEASIQLKASVAWAEVNEALNLWGAPDGNRQAIEVYEHLLEKYRSSDGRFETAVLTAIALHHLEEGRRHEFDLAVQRLQGYAQRQRVLQRETEYVLALSESLTGGDLVAGGDVRLKGAIVNLLNPDSK